MNEGKIRAAVRLRLYHICAVVVSSGFYVGICEDKRSCGCSRTNQDARVKEKAKDDPSSLRIRSGPGFDAELESEIR